MWHVIQTITGKEQELENVIWKVIDRECYHNCFVLYQECFWRKKGELERDMEPLFPSYVFVETDRPEEFLVELKRLPKVSRFLGMDGCFWGIYEEEELFLQRLMEEGCDQRKEEKFSERLLVNSKKSVEENWAEEPKRNCLIYPSLVWVDEKGQIVRAEGVLKFYMDKIVKQRLRKRSVVIEIPFGGQLRRIRLGIRLEEDEFLSGAK